jgi:hypothetical protein
MNRICAALLPLLLLTFPAPIARGQDAKAVSSTFRLDSLDGLEVLNAKAEVATYEGRHAVRLLNRAEVVASGAATREETIAILKGSDFKDGTIEAEIAGIPREGAPADVRGFIGIAFRVQPDKSHYECIYIRATNGRADDQLRRNHSAQYVSSPDFPWQRLRKENPGVYESYVDLEAGAWTRIKIVVSGTKAKLYVNGAEQPCLIVNDLKLGERRGQIALWVGTDTDAHFSNLTVR